MSVNNFEKNQNHDKIQLSREQYCSTFFDARQAYLVMKIFGSTLVSLKGTKIKELQKHAAPAHGTLVCRGTPVGNHRSRV